MSAQGNGQAQTPATNLAGKPKWLVLGGMGFIGRNFVKYLIDNAVASDIRIVDKKAPFMAFLSEDHKAAILGRPDVIEYVQADISDRDMCEDAFRPPRTGGTFDYVINLAAETAHGKPDEFYQKTVTGAQITAALSSMIGVKKYVFVSSANVYKPSSKPSNESATIGPWSQQASSLLAAEQALAGVSGLPYVILRPSLVYGPGDVTSIMPRCAIAATYKACGDKMEFLWDADLKTSTVHVFDVVRACFLAARKAPAGAVYNVSDKNDTSAGFIANALSEIFGITTGFLGNMASKLASVKMDSIVDAANENHLGPWLALLKKHNIANTPLSPFLHKVLLKYNNVSIDGSSIEQIGFQYLVPAPSVESIRDPVMAAIHQGVFPPIL